MPPPSRQPHAGRIRPFKRTSAFIPSVFGRVAIGYCFGSKATYINNLLVLVVLGGGIWAIYPSKEDARIAEGENEKKKKIQVRGDPGIFNLIYAHC